MIIIFVLISAVFAKEEDSITRRLFKELSQQDSGKVFSNEIILRKYIKDDTEYKQKQNGIVHNYEPYARAIWNEFVKQNLGGKKGQNQTTNQNESDKSPKQNPTPSIKDLKISDIFFYISEYKKQKLAEEKAKSASNHQDKNENTVPLSKNEPDFLEYAKQKLAEEDAYYNIHHEKQNSQTPNNEFDSFEYNKQILAEEKAKSKTHHQEAMENTLPLSKNKLDYLEYIKQKLAMKEAEYNIQNENQNKKPSINESKISDIYSFISEYVKHNEQQNRRPSISNMTITDLFFYIYEYEKQKVAEADAKFQKHHQETKQNRTLPLSKNKFDLSEYIKQKLAEVDE